MKKIRKTILLIDTIDLNDLTKEAVNELFDLANKQGISNIRFNKYYDRWEAEDVISIVGDRLETDDELKCRMLAIEKAKKDAEKKEAKKAAKEKRTYERLKKKFEEK